MKRIIYAIVFSVLIQQNACGENKNGELVANGTINSAGINPYINMPIGLSSGTVWIGTTNGTSGIPLTFRGFGAGGESDGYYYTTPSSNITITWTVPATMTVSTATYPLGIYEEAMSSTNPSDVNAGKALKRTDTTIYLTIASGVSLPTLCSNLFKNSTSFKTITINATSANVTSMSHMFHGCTGLTSTSLSSTFLSNAGKTNALDLRYMFDGCSALTSIATNNSSYVFPTTNYISNLSYMFQGCTSLSTVPYCIRNLNTSNVTDMSYMFKGCTAITSAGLSSTFLSNAGKTNTLNLSYMFDGCSALTSIATNNSSYVFPATNYISNLSYMFRNCTSLSTVPYCIRNLNTSNVTDMSYMFYGCSGLTSLNWSSCDTSNVTTMGSMFYNCSALKTLSLGNLNMTKVTTAYNMFTGCTALETLTMTNFTPHSTGTTSNRTPTFQALFSPFKTSIKTFSITGTFNLGNRTTAANMFDGCTGLSSLTIGTFSASSLTNMSYMFNGCTSLPTLDLSGFNTSNVTDFSYMFSDCSLIKRLKTSSNFVINPNANVTDMFYGCSKNLFTSNTISDDNRKTYSALSMGSQISGLSSYGITSSSKWYLIYKLTGGGTDTSLAIATSTQKTNINSATNGNYSTAYILSITTSDLGEGYIDNKGDAFSTSLGEVIETNNRLLCGEIGSGGGDTTDYSIVFSASSGNGVYLGVSGATSPGALTIPGAGTIAADLINVTATDLSPSTDITFTGSTSGTLTFSGNNSALSQGSVTLGDGTSSSTIAFANSDSLPSTQITVNPNANMSFSGTNDYTPKNDITVESGAGFSSAGTVHLRSGNLTLN